MVHVNRKFNAKHLCVLKNMLLFHKAADNELGQLKF